MPAACLSDDALSHLAAGTLLGDERALAEAHLAGCGHCQSALQQVSSLVLSKTLANAALGPDGSQRVTQLDATGTQPSATPSGTDTQPDRSPPAEKGTQLGRYVLLERLAQGGMGEVYAAYDPQLDRRVALKLLRTGALSRDEGKARLLREAQAMARLAHPNVVAVHDVGLVDERVFVAMEFVDGETLGQWLRAPRPWREVLELFVAAGAGLAHAHHAGIVHRDFKPDNVLVGADGRPRVLDFGLARHHSSAREAKTDPGLPDVALEGPLAAQLTRDGAIMGTPGYMAPEQLASLPTDARTDQFAFCITLWEALYGKRPFGGATLRAHADQVQAGKLPARPAGTEVPEWVHQALVRGLAPGPEDRWPSMDALLLALKPRRQRASWRIAASVALLGVIAAGATGIAVTSRERFKVCGGTRERLAGIWDDNVKKHLGALFLQGGRASRAESWKTTQAVLDTYADDWARAAEQTCLRGRVQKTDTEAAYEEKSLCLEGHLRQLQAHTRLLAGGDRQVLTNALRASRSLDPVALCTDTLALGGRRRDRAARPSPGEEALAATLREARALLDTGQYAKSAELATAALEKQGPAWLLADGWLRAGVAQLRAGQTAAAEKCFFEALINAEQAGAHDAAARAWARLAGLLAQAGTNLEAGHKDLRLARANAVRAGMPGDVEADIENSEGQLDLAASSFENARTHFTRALALQEAALGEFHTETAMTLNNLGVALSRLGKYDEALRVYQRVLQVQLQISGAEHPLTASTMQNIAVILTRGKRYSEALEFAERALAIREATLGPDHPDVATSLQSLSKLHGKMGADEKSLAALERALAIREKEGPQTVPVAQVHDDLAHFFRDRRDKLEALEYAQKALAIFDRELGVDSPRSAGTRELLGLVYGDLGEWGKAQEQLELALSVRQKKLGEFHSDVASSLNALGDLARAQLRHEKARGYYEQAYRVREKALGADRPELATDLLGVGRSLLDLRRAAEAARVLERAVKMRERGDEAADLALARFDLARALWEQGAEQRPRALALCEQARDALPANGGRSEVEKWLAVHAPPGPPPTRGPEP